MDSRSGPHLHASTCSPSHDEIAEVTDRVLEEQAVAIKEFLHTTSQGTELFLQDMSHRNPILQKPFDFMVDGHYPPGASPLTYISLSDIAAILFSYNWYFVEQYYQRALKIEDAIEGEAETWRLLLEVRESDIVEVVHTQMLLEKETQRLSRHEIYSSLNHFLDCFLRARKLHSPSKYLAPPPTANLVDGIMNVSYRGESAPPSFTFHASQADVKAFDFTTRLNRVWNLVKESKAASDIRVSDFEATQRRVLYALKSAALCGNLFSLSQYQKWIGLIDDTSTHQHVWIGRSLFSSSNYLSAGRLTDRQRRRYKFATQIARGAGR